MNINYIYCGTVHGILTADGNSRTVCALLASASLNTRNNSNNNESTTGADASVKVQDMKLLADLASLAS